MSNPNSGVGAGISFNGPVALSGLALSKQYILQTMDNYVKFMSGMLKLFGEDVHAYATATVNSANYESTTITKQAWGDLASGISSGMSGLITFGTMVHGSFADNKDLAIGDKAKSQSGNFDSTLDDLNSAENKAMRTPPGSIPSQIAVGPSGNPDTTVDTNIQRLENGNSTAYKAFGENGTKTKRGGSTNPDQMSYSDAESAVKELVRRSRTDVLDASGNVDPVATAAQQKLAEKSLANIKDRFHEKKKVADNEKQSADGKVTNSTQKRTMVTQMVQNFSQAGSAAVKYYMANGKGTNQAIAKERSVYASSNQQLNQQMLSSTESTAQKAAQHAEDLVQLERQIQANNVTRG